MIAIVVLISRNGTGTARSPGPAPAPSRPGRRPPRPSPVPTGRPRARPTSRRLAPAAPPPRTGARRRRVATAPPGGPLPDVPGVRPAPPPAPPRERSILGRVTLSVALIVVGVLIGWNGATDSDVPVRVIIAAALGVVGLGLVVGAFVGRARGLVVLGVLLTLLVSAAAVADIPVRGGVGDRTWRPATVSDLHDPYRLGVGQSELDLTRLDLASAGRTRVEIRQGVGDLLVSCRTTSWSGSTPTSNAGELLAAGPAPGQRDRPVRAGRAAGGIRAVGRGPRHRRRAGRREPGGASCDAMTWTCSRWWPGSCSWPSPSGTCSTSPRDSTLDGRCVAPVALVAIGVGRPGRACCGTTSDRRPSPRWPTRSRRRRLSCRPAGGLALSSPGPRAGHPAGCPSGQWERTVNPSAMPSKVRILHLPRASSPRPDHRSGAVARHGGERSAIELAERAASPVSSSGSRPLSSVGRASPW